MDGILQEQELYQKEGLGVNEVHYVDNQDCIGKLSTLSLRLRPHSFNLTLTEQQLGVRSKMTDMSSTNIVKAVHLCGFEGLSLDSDAAVVPTRSKCSNVA